ncbi:hypothetical protein JNB_00345 [Janibacter sp. HTCC2649]|uniref:DUF2306 domain-containing protein n=1 Tax=Janibacter sp. HTCC2649 TaxID=313589 RepID=UPI000066EB1D|nr:DUF2306 domain-containing protein [Janibacter sp. HTCC2649]EAP98571.1 hypothetical protein JNB_00345 [Janibacter sp. HTCC2649]
MSTASVRRPEGRARSGWRAPLALVALALIPLLAGTARLVELAGGPGLIPSDTRFTASPWAVAMHIVSAAVYAVLGSMQFAVGFRLRHPGWHRRSGRVLVVAGLGVALSALWLTLFFPPQPDSGLLLFVLRIGFGSAMIACLGLGVAAIRHGDVARHRAWMTRAYAIALAAGTQAFTEGIGSALLGDSPLALDASRGAAWVINLAVAEWVIRRASVPELRSEGRGATGSGERAGRGGVGAATTYEFRVEGHLDAHWSAVLGGLALRHDGDGTSTLTGELADQSQLHGVLAGLRDVGAPLISVRELAGSSRRVEHRQHPAPQRGVRE